MEGERAEFPVTKLGHMGTVLVPSVFWAPQWLKPQTKLEGESSLKAKNLWHSAKWKWIVVAGLLAWAFVLSGLPFKFFPLKPKLAPRGKLAPVWDGAYAKLVLRRQTNASHQLALTSSIVNQAPTLSHQGPVDQFEVDLHSGEFILRQTDFFIADAIPLALVRTYHSWSYESTAFGMGTSHPYDIAPTGNRNPYTFLDLNLEDGRTIHFKRISEGTGYTNAMYEHDDTSSPFYGARFSWDINGHWTFRMHDGSSYLFPEAYRAKNQAQAAAFEIRDGSGNRMQLIRDGEGNLRRIISASGHLLDLTVDERGRIVRAEDDNENTRYYKYDATGHLTRISQNGHTLYRFEYETLPVSKGWDDHFMARIFDDKGRKILENKYASTRLVEQHLGDGEIYHFDYQSEAREVVATTVKYPDGKIKVFRFYRGRLIPE